MNDASKYPCPHNEDNVEKFNQLVNIEVIELEDTTSEKAYLVPNNKNSLLKPKYIQELQDIIACGYNSNNGMSRDESITMVFKLYHCFNYSKCEQHCN